MASEEERTDMLRLSQLSQLSNVSLELSQNTLNDLLMVNANGQCSEELHVDQSEESSSRSSSCSSGSSLATPTPNPAICIQRTFIYPASVSSYQPNSHIHQQYSSLPVYSASHHPAVTPPHSTPPPAVSPIMSEAGHHQLSPLPCAARVHQSQSSYMQQDFSRPKIPCNVGFPGPFDFGLVLNEEEKPVPKTATFTYSSMTKRAYIRRDTAIGMAFTFNAGTPPSHATIRAMAIHKAPELVGEVLQCCPKHIDEQSKRFHKFPRHFVCGTSNSEAVYCEEPISGRLSVTHCVRSMQPKSENVLQAFYTFPCFTSELHKGPGQLVQLLFTLEINGQIVGRATLDARVCASPGRDRENDEAKLSPVTPNRSLPPSGGSTSLTEHQRRGRKRSSSTVTQSLEYTAPSKISPNEVGGRKQQYMAETYPELFPFIDVCIKMMESVYSVQIDSNNGGSTAGSEGMTQQAAAFAAAASTLVATGAMATPGGREERRPEEPSSCMYCTSTGSPPTSSVQVFDDVESWLRHIDMMHYKRLFEARGVMLISQVLGLDDNQLLSFGINNVTHRRQLLDGMKLIQVATTPIKQEDSEELDILQHSSDPFIPHLLSQGSVGSAPNMPGGLEVLRIQVRNTFNSSGNN